MTKRKAPSALAEQLIAAIGANGPKPCKLCTAMTSMTAEEISALEEALHRTKSGRHAVSVATLVAILKDSGYSVSRAHIEVHRQEQHP